MAEEAEPRVKVNEVSIQNNEVVRKAREYAEKSHGDNLHPYTGKLFMEHLDGAAKIALKFLDKVRDVDKGNAVAACYAHLLMQYCGKTYTEIVNELNETIADMVLLITPYRGKNRKEQQPLVYYEKLKENESALFVKICARISNAELSMKARTNIFAVYYREKSEFTAFAHVDQYDQMICYYTDIFKELDEI